jgi:putative peptidoglycan lipid II flippase
VSDSYIPVTERAQVSQAAGTVGFYTFLSRILGLVRDVVVARFFGAGLVTDAFFVAFRIPNLLRRLFAEGSLTIAFIPVFTEYLSMKTREDAFKLARVVLTLLSVLLVVVTVLGIVLAPWIVRIQAFGFGDSGIRYELTVLLTRITFPYILLISLVAFFMGILNSMRHFAAPAAAPIFLNVGIIASTLWLSPHFSEPVVGVAIGVLIGGVLQVLLQIPWVLKKGLSLVPAWVPHHPAVKRIGLLMLPAVFGSAIYQFNQFIGTLLASFLAEGSVSWLYYADRLVQFPLGVFAIAISTAALPSLSREVAHKDLGQFRDTLAHALRMVSFITIPSMVGLIVLGRLIIQVFFERGVFGPDATAMTYQALLFYALGLWAFSGIRIMVSAFYAFQDTKTPVKVAFVTLIANLILSLILMGPLRHGGLALALSLASSIQLTLLIFFLKRRLVEWEISPILLSAGKSLLASIVMGVGIYYLYSHGWVPNPQLGIGHLVFRLSALVCMGVFIYFATSSILGCPELSLIWNTFKQLLRREKAED